MLFEYKALVFDMDGVIIDSEPLWRRAMIYSFKNTGIPFTEEDCIKTTGMRLIEVILFWQKIYPDKIINPQNLYNQIITNLIELIKEKGEAKSGFYELVNFLKENNMKIGLATSSDYLLTQVVLDKLQIKDEFDAVVSAEKLPYGKPHPEVYIQCAKKLDVAPATSIAIEDSVNGIISAKAAQMFVIGVPEGTQKNNVKFTIADILLDDLHQVADYIGSRLKNTAHVRAY